MIKTLIKFSIAILSIGLILFAITACTTTPPNNREDICSIFRQYPDWYWSAEKVEKKWNLPINVLMAIMYQESRFSQSAKPPRGHILWVIPWFRPTSAFGYSQAVKSTWMRYKRATGNAGASRDSFADAADFIGWYSQIAALRLGISKANAYTVYLAYHEGMGGYEHGTYKRKKWLIAVAKKVQRRSWLFKTQLLKCRGNLPNKPWWHFWG